MLVAFEWTYSISDNIMYEFNDSLDQSNLTSAAYQSYTNTREIMYAGATGFLIPILLFLTISSSFIDRNQSLISYIVHTMGILVITPVVIYLFAELFTSLTSVTFLDSAYYADVYFDNFLIIMVANLLFSLASFLFVRQNEVRSI